MQTSPTPRQSGERARMLHIAGENGEAFEVSSAPGEALRLPPLPIGYHEAWFDDAPDERCRLIVAPRRCYLPDEIAAHRSFGLAAHLYALRRRGDRGIGDFSTLTCFGETAARMGGTVAGINPLHHLFPTDRDRASPYQPSDRRFIDPIYIDIDALLAEFRLPTALRLAGDKQLPSPISRGCAISTTARVWAEKSAILEAAFEDFLAVGRNRRLRYLSSANG